MTRLLPFVAMAGCLVNGDLYDERVRELTPCEPQTVWRDDDGDGWGTGPASARCDPEAKWVGNGRDCDDTDPDITGRVALFCPHDFATDSLGLIVGEDELLVTVGADDALYRAAAADRCEAWGGTLGDLASPERLDAVVALLPPGWLGHTAAFGGAWPDGSSPPRCPTDPGPPGEDLLTAAGCFVTVPLRDAPDAELVCERPLPRAGAWEGVGSSGEDTGAP